VALLEKAVPDAPRIAVGSGTKTIFVAGGGGGKTLTDCQETVANPPQLRGVTLATAELQARSDGGPLSRTCTAAGHSKKGERACRGCCGPYPRELRRRRQAGRLSARQLLHDWYSGIAPFFLTQGYAVAGGPPHAGGGRSETANKKHYVEADRRAKAALRPSTRRTKLAQSPDGVGRGLVTVRSVHWTAHHVAPKPTCYGTE